MALEWGEAAEHFNEDVGNNSNIVSGKQFHWS